MDAGTIARFDEFEFALATLELRRRSRRLRLAPQPARVLAVLVRQQGRLVTREALKAAIWSDDTFVEFDQGLTFCIKRLRAALGDDARNPRFIETIPRRGYRFIAPVSFAEPSPLETVAPEAETAAVQQLPAAAIQSAPASRTPRRSLLAIAASVVIAVVAVAFIARNHTSRASAPVRLAVLPFANLSADRSQAYLSEGFVEELIAQLNRIEPGRLAVVGRTSSARYDDQKRDLPDIAARLNVSYLVEGSVRRDGDRLRIMAQLVDPGQRVPVWSNTYERDASELLVLQEDVAGAVAREVGAVLVRRGARRPIDPRVHELYLRGRFFWNRRAPAELAKAADLFRDAIRIDPGYARAQAGLGDAYMSGALGLSDRPAFVRALAAADEAIALDDTLSEAYVTRAHALSHLFDWENAERAYRRAIELDPNYGPARYLFSEWLSCHGRFAEGIREAQIARDLDPVSAIATHVLGTAHLYAREYDRAADLFRQALELDPHHAWSHDRLGQLYMATGDAAKARVEFARFAELDPRHVLPSLRAEARFGDAVHARAAIDDVLKKNPDDVMGATWAYAALGDTDRALAWLDRAIAAGHYQTVFLAIDPRLDPLRDDPRFAGDLRRVGLSPVEIAGPTR